MDGTLTLVTGPSIEPITLQEAKLHLRIDDDQTDEDALIAALIRSAREHVETAILGRSLITRTWDYHLPGFPAGDAIALPRPPLRTVTSVTYYDSAGAGTVWDASNYLVDTAAFVGRLVLGYGTSWPSFTPRPVNPVVVRYTAGYGDGAGDVPERYRLALLLLVAEWYERREATHIGLQGASAVTPLPFAVKALLADRVRSF